MQPVELGAPLHGPARNVPKPAPHARERLAALETNLGLCQCRLGEDLLGSVPCDNHGAGQFPERAVHPSQGNGCRDCRPVSQLHFKVKMAHLGATLHLL